MYVFLRSIYYFFRTVFFDLATIISPTLNTRLRYWDAFHKKLDLENPKDLNEKNLWLKLKDYGHNELVRQCADKYGVREYVQKCGCGEILNELIVKYESPEEIQWDSLPNQFAMKLNSGCGGNIICSDKSKLDFEQCRRNLKKWIRKKYYLAYSEMQYKDVKPIIIVEKYLKDGNGLLPVDYKFYCMNGRAEYLMLCIGREYGHPKFYWYNRNWEFVPFEEKKDPHIEKPELMDEAFKYADILSKPFPFVRTDLYIIDNRIIFGELTFTSAGGMDKTISQEALNIMGDMIDLKYSNKLI